MGCGCGKTALKQAKNASKAMLEIATGHAFKVDESTYIDRINRCKECDKLNKSSMRCNVCGCFIQVKARYKGSNFECPEGKWE